MPVAPPQRLSTHYFEVDVKLKPSIQLHFCLIIKMAGKGGIVLVHKKYYKQEDLLIRRETHGRGRLAIEHETGNGSTAL